MRQPTGSDAVRGYIQGVPSHTTRKIVQWVATVGLLLAACLAVAYGLRSGDWLHGVLAGLTLAMAVFDTIERRTSAA
jgi:hypothetical protein